MIESFENTISKVEASNGKGPGLILSISTLSSTPANLARRFAASQTGFSTSTPITRAASCSHTSRTAQAPDPEPMSRTNLSAISTPVITRATSSGPPGDRNPSPQISSRNPMTCVLYRISSCMCYSYQALKHFN